MSHSNSEVSICNTALNMLGANNIISLTEDSKNARLCNQRFHSVRDAVFREHTWNCLVKRVQLPQEIDKPSHEFQFQYLLPADTIKVLSIGSRDDGTHSDLSDGFRFKVEGRKILTNEEEVFLTYSAQIEDVVQLDSLLVECLATRLAAEIAYAITSSVALSKQLKDDYAEKLRIARHADATEGTPDVVDSSSFINSRY